MSAAAARQGASRHGGRPDRRALVWPGVVSRRAAVVAAMVIAGGLLAGCGAAGVGQHSLTLYSGQHVQTTDSLVAAFEKATGHHRQRPQRRRGYPGRPDRHGGRNSPADVFYTENSPPLEYLQGKGLLGPVRHLDARHVPGQYSSPQGDWVGVSARVSVIVYNPEPDLPRASFRPASASSPSPLPAASWPWPRRRPTSSRS